jgi:hypothetical protein
MKRLWRRDCQASATAPARRARGRRGAPFLTWRDYSATLDGVSQRPVWADRERASSTDMLATASSSGTGAGWPSTIAFEKRSP